MTFATDASEDLTAFLKANASEKAQEAAYYLVGKLKVVLSGAGRGKLARIPGTKRKYRQSRPGDPPAKRLGYLATSIDVQARDKGQRFLVGSRDFHHPKGGRINYGEFLEAFERTEIRRPWLFPTAMKNLTKLRQIMAKGWNRYRDE